MSGYRVIQSPDRETWLAKRQELGGVGASSVGTILGFSNWDSPFSLYCRLKGLIPQEEQTPEQHLGHLMEPVVTQLYTETTGRRVYDPGDFAIFQSLEYPWMTATLDRIILCPTCELIPVYGAPSGLHSGKCSGPGPGVLELKAHSYFVLDDWETEPPAEVQCQLQAQMTTFGVGWGSAALLAGGEKFRYFDVKRNDAFCFGSGKFPGMVEEVRRFVENLANDEPPQIDGHQRTSQALKALYPKPTHESIILPDDALAWDQALQEAKEQAAEIKGRISLYENLFRNALGSAVSGQFSNGLKYTLKETQRGGYTVEPTSYRVLRRSEGKLYKLLKKTGRTS